MTNRARILAGVMALLALVWLGFSAFGGGGSLEGLVLQRPNQPLRFAFNRPETFRELKLIRIEPGPPGEEASTWDRTIWHMVTDPEREAEPSRGITYGRWIRGMRPAEGFNRRGEPIQSGAPYRFEATTTRGDHITLDFTGS